MRLAKYFLRTALLLACLSFLVTAAHAQYRAGIQGVVLDSQGASVPGATVTLTNKETNQIRTATADRGGAYTFTNLAPSHYSMTVEKAGFKKQVLEDVVISTEQIQAVNVTLEVGTANQSVTVNSEVAPPIDTETGNISGTLTTEDIQALPSFGRDPYQLARLAPGVFGDGATGTGGGGTALPGSNQSSSGSTGSIFMTENQPQIVAGGTRNNGNSYQIDGVEVNSLAWGGSAVITPNEESVKEVQIQANPYSAENGRNSGAQVLVVSKSGTNQFHGSAFIKIHRPGLDAYQRWGGPFGQPQRDANRFNQFGGSVGGPVIKNRLFFFFSYETLRNNTVGQGTGWYVTPQLLTQLKSTAPIASQYASFPGAGVVFSKINSVACAQVGLPATQCNTITDSSGNPLGLDVGSPMTGATVGTQDPTFGQSATPFGVGGGLKGTPDVFNVTTVQPVQQTATQYNGRADFQLTNKDLLTYSLYWVPNDSTFFNGPAFSSNQWHSNRLNYADLLLWDHTFSPTLINEARFDVTRWWFDEVKSNPQEAFGFPADNINGIGQVGLACCPVFGAPGPGVFYQTTYNVRDTLTKVLNSHSLKFGTDIYKEQDNDVTTWAGIPNYQFNNLWAFANDAPISESSYFDPRTGKPTSSYKYIRSNIYAFFVQDDYKVKSNLTVNVGLRWEYFGPLHEKNNNLGTTLLGNGANTLTGLSIRAGGNLYNSSHNNWGPQIGFAWSPTGILSHEFDSRLVIRGGAGIAYNRMQEAVTLNGRFNPPLVVQLNNLTGSNIVYSLSNAPHNIYGYPSNGAAVETFSSTTGLPTCAPSTCAPVSLTAFDQNLPTPVVYRYSLEGQYDFGHAWGVATVGYQGSQSRHFTRQINNLNWLYPSGLNPAVQGVDFYTNDANAHYNALLTEFQHQFSQSFQGDVQYTYSSCMDHGSQDYYADPYPFNVAASYGHCDFDATHSFKAFAIWTPPIFRGANDWKGKVLGGWELSGIYTYHSGFPFSPFYGVNVINTPSGNTCSLIYDNSGFCNTEPAAYTGGAGSNYSNATFKQPFGNFPNLATNPNAYFTLPTLSSTGVPPTPGVQRNSFRGPRYQDFDFTLGKDFGLPSMRILGEGAKLSLHANFYNLFNTLNLQPLGSQQFLGNITLDATTNKITSFTPNTGFGQAQGALGARVVELQARFSF